MWLHKGLTEWQLNTPNNAVVIAGAFGARHTTEAGRVTHHGTLTDKSGPQEDVYRTLTNTDADLLLSIQYNSQFALQTPKEDN